MPDKPQFKVGAYVPKAEPDAVLVPLLGVDPDNIFIGPVARKGEMSYELLKQACEMQPVWLFDCQAVAL